MGNLARPGGAVVSGRYLVRFVGGPAHGTIREVEELLGTLRLPVYDLPSWEQSPATPYVPGVAVYTLTRTPDGGGFYQYQNYEGLIK